MAVQEVLVCDQCGKRLVETKPQFNGWYENLRKGIAEGIEACSAVCIAKRFRGLVALAKERPDEVADADGSPTPEELTEAAAAEDAADLSPEQPEPVVAPSGRQRG